MNGMKEQKVIFVVGPDMTGKTEISSALSTAIGIPRFKASTEHKTFLNEQDDFLLQVKIADPRVCDLLKQTGYSIIFDRGYPCEWAYSELMGRETDREFLIKLDEMFSSLNTYIIFCYRSSYDGIFDDLCDSIDSSKLVEIDKNYRAFMSISKCKKLFLNVDDECIIREVGEILHFLNA